MALIQLEKIGVDTFVNCSLVRDDLLQNAFYSTVSNPVFWSDNVANLDGGNDIFKKLGDDAAYAYYYSGTGNLYEYSRTGTGTGRIISYYTFLCSEILSPTGTSDVNYFAFDFAQQVNGLSNARFCLLNRKQSNAPTIIEAIPNSRFSKCYLPFDVHCPVRFSIIVDTETKELNIFVLYSFGWQKKQAHSIINTVDERKNAYKALENFFSLPSSDPWIDGGESTTGGGDGNLDITSDTIGLGALPISAVNTGFIQAFAPSISEVQELSSYMWSDGFLNLLSKFWNDPMSIIISLTQFPFFIPSTSSKIVQAGNVTTDVKMRVPDSQYVTLDCGKLNVDKFYDAYVDFEPYTQCEIFLPYIVHR